MRTVATYLLECNLHASDAARSHAVSTIQLIDRWFRRKGARESEELTAYLEGADREVRRKRPTRIDDLPAISEHARFTYPRDARAGSIDREVVATADGSLITWVLSEIDHRRQRFVTTVRLARHLGQLVVTVRLQSGAARHALAPVNVTINRPRIVNHLLDQDVVWKRGGQVVPARPKWHLGEHEGRTLAQIILAQRRALPAVVVSQDGGPKVRGRLHHELGDELVGLASVHVVDEAASRALAARVGREMSCSRRGVRIYWPGFTRAQAPTQHPYWNWEQLWAMGRDSVARSHHLRHAIRGRILAVSATSWRDHDLVIRIEHARRHERLLERIHAIQDQRALEEMVEEMRLESQTTVDDIGGVSDELEAEREKIQTIEELAEETEEKFLAVSKENATLTGQLAELEATAARRETAIEVFHPRTLMLAARLGMAGKTEGIADVISSAADRLWFPDLDAVVDHFEKHVTQLVFGENVREGTSSFPGSPAATTATFHHLNVLAIAAQTWKEQGKLGDEPEAWFRNWGVSASQERPNTKRSSTMVDNRTWGDGMGGKATYLFHTKPISGTTISKVLRIYAEWSEERQVYVVGWIGRKPDV